MKRLLFFLSLITLLAGSVEAKEPPSEPILKIETGMHTAVIKRIGIDRDERFLVTGSDDKTIRVWELKTGRLLRTIRPPIDEGNVGRIYAVAVSPDGRYIAAGGWTDYEGEYQSLYIFELSTGRLIKRLSGLPNAINHITYSRDGRFLAIGLGRNNGIRVFKTDDYSLVKEDKDYADTVYSLDFSKDGRLVATSWDGYIRLYDEKFRLISKEEAPGGRRPFHIHFSPDGKEIAVGYHDSVRVDILSAHDQSLIYTPYTGDLSNCKDLFSVTWSSNFLYAGGICPKFIDNEWKWIIRRWDKMGRGKPVDIPVAKSTIFHILPLSSGGVAFSSGEPSFGIIDGNGRLGLNKKPETADYRDQEILISYDGSIVKFGYEQFGKSPAVFDVRSRQLKDTTDTILLRPITEGDEIKVTDWFNNYQPKLKGIPIKLEQYETSRSLAISPDGSRFLLGADWYLRAFDKRGNELWKVAAPSVTWAVNISGDGELAIAGYGDGTIRWYRMRDGREILSFFPHRDRKRWVIWTPKGYYDTSPDGEGLIGWHINNGWDNEAGFYPVSRFRERFYRPDVIARLLSTYDEEKAISLANEESGRRPVEASIKETLPPVITILSPADGSRFSSTELTVRYLIKSPSQEPVTGIKVLIDGRPVSKERGVQIRPKPDKGELEELITVNVPPRDIELSLIAENRFGSSEPSTVRLYWEGKKEEYVIKPKLYILAIGISKYKDQSLRLNFAHKDAKDFVDTMLRQKGKLYEDVKVKLLTDEGATKEEILDGLEWIQRETTHKDVAMLFIAGHGLNDPAGIYYFLPHNADLERLKRTALAFSDIKNTVTAMPGKVVMFVDTCHAGGVMGKRGYTDLTGVINELTSAENGVVVFASSTGRQYSLEDPAWGNGAFTKAVVEGIMGKADLLKKGKITINMLDAFVAERVKELTKGRQTPVTTKPQTIPDFPLATTQ